MEQYGAVTRTREIQEQEILEKVIKEKEMVLAEKQKEQRERERTMRNLLEEYRLQDAAVKTKQKQEETVWKAWQMMQRFKRSEYNRQNDLEERKQQWKQKEEYRNELQRDIVSIYFSNENLRIIIIELNIFTFIF